MNEKYSSIWIDYNGNDGVVIVSEVYSKELDKLIIDRWKKLKLLREVAFYKQ